MHLRCSCDAPAMHFRCTRLGSHGGVVPGHVPAADLPYTCGALLMHLPCTPRQGTARTCPASVPGQEPGDVGDAQSAPAGCGREPRQRAPARRPHGSRAGHPRGESAVFPPGHGRGIRAAGISEVNRRCMGCGKAPGLPFPGAGTMGYGEWPIWPPAVTPNPASGKFRCLRVPKKGPETGFILMSAISPAAGRSSPHAVIHFPALPCRARHSSPAARHRSLEPAPGTPWRAAPGCR